MNDPNTIRKPPRPLGVWVAGWTALVVLIGVGVYAYVITWAGLGSVYAQNDFAARRITQAEYARLLAEYQGAQYAVPLGVLLLWLVGIAVILLAIKPNSPVAPDVH